MHSGEAISFQEAVFPKTSAYMQLFFIYLRKDTLPPAKNYFN